MDPLDIVRARHHTQRVTSAGFATPEEVVRWLGAVQSQEYWGAKWSLAQRMKRAGDASLDAAFNSGRLLRTHILRPTWHFVLPGDIRWMQQLTAPRVRAFMAYYDRMLELDRAFLDRCESVMAEALAGGRSMTRTEVAARLGEAGVEAKGQRLGHIVMHAELDLLICSGPLKGKQHTYMLLDERASAAPEKFDREESLARLTKLFFTSHGPATARDFAWWSSLTAADVKTGLEMAGGSLEREIVDGREYWHGGGLEGVKVSSGAAYLVPAYDETHIGYQDLKVVLADSGAAVINDGTSLMESPVVMNGRVPGTWKRTFEKREVAVAVKLFKAPSPAQSVAIEAAASRFGKFLGMPERLSVEVV